MCRTPLSVYDTVPKYLALAARVSLAVRLPRLGRRDGRGRGAYGYTDMSCVYVDYLVPGPLYSHLNWQRELQSIVDWLYIKREMLAYFQLTVPVPVVFQ